MTRDSQAIYLELKELERKRAILENERTELYWAERRLQRKAKKSSLIASPWVNEIGQTIDVGDPCVGVTANRGAKATVGTFAGYNERGNKVTSVCLNVMKNVLYYTLDGKEYKRYPRTTDTHAFRRVMRVNKQEQRKQSFTGLKVFKLAGFIQPTIG